MCVFYVPVDAWFQISRGLIFFNLIIRMVFQTGFPLYTYELFDAMYKVLCMVQDAHLCLQCVFLDGVVPSECAFYATHLPVVLTLAGSCRFPTRPADPVYSPTVLLSVVGTAATKIEKTVVKVVNICSRIISQSTNNSCNEFMVQVRLRQKYYAPRVRPDQGFEPMISRSWQHISC